MLAGRMKLKHFLVLISLVGIAGIVVLVKACKSDEPAPDPQVAVTPRDPPAPPPTPPPDRDRPQPPAELPIDVLRARDWDSEVLAWKDKSIPGDKVKDASKGRSYKINVYKDAGHTTVNRAKVDINRNDKFDEKYTFEAGKITLQRAPNDDEQYTETYHWTGDGWKKQ